MTDPEKTVEFTFEGKDQTCATIVVRGEDHTLGNSLRYALMKKRDVDFAGYCIPHPSENLINMRVQTTQKKANLVVVDAIEDLENLSNHILETFNDEVKAFQA